MQKKLVATLIILTLVFFNKFAYSAAINTLEKTTESNIRKQTTELVSKMEAILDDCFSEKLMLLSEEYLEKKLNHIPNDHKKKLLRLITQKAKQKDLTCYICWERLIPGQKICDKKETIKCEHKYHQRCLEDWQTTHKNRVHCPSCQDPKNLSSLDDLLFSAARHGQTEKADLFLQNGAHIDCKRDCGCTPLITAISRGHKATTKLLITNGADIDCYTKCDVTPLITASSLGLEEISDLLVKKNAEIDRANKHGLTALMMASRCGHKTIAQLLIENKANVNHRSENHDTPLIEAVSANRLEIARMLIECNAEVNHKSKDGLTPLMVTALNKVQNPKIRQLLIENRANEVTRKQILSFLCKSLYRQGTDTFYKQAFLLLVTYIFIKQYLI